MKKRIIMLIYPKGARHHIDYVPYFGEIIESDSDIGIVTKIKTNVERVLAQGSKQGDFNLQYDFYYSTEVTLTSIK